METKTTTPQIAPLAEKKTWENPTLTIIDQGDVNSGGANPGPHEGTVTAGKIPNYIS